MPKRTAPATKATRHAKKSAHRLAPAAAGDPVFAQPQPTPDPTSFREPVTDQSDKEVASVEPVPLPSGNAVEPVLTLAQVYGSQGAAKTKAITTAGQIVFHCVGDTGSVKGPTTQSLVADKMVADFNEPRAADVPSFFFHLGDLVYYFGEGKLLLRPVLRSVPRLPGADRRDSGQS